MYSQIIARENGGLLYRRPHVNSIEKSWDNGMLELCLKGDEGAWCEFVQYFQPLIAAVIVKTLRRCTNPNPSVVDDLVQETYLKLCAKNFRALRRFKSRHANALAGFLKVVASNVTQDYLRGVLSCKRGSGKGEDDLEKAIPTSVSMAGSTATIERAIVLCEIQKCLKSQRLELNFDRDSKIFSLYYQDGLTAAAISQEPGIGLSVKGVESVLFRLTDLLSMKLNKTTQSECSVAEMTV